MLNIKSANSFGSDVKKVIEEIISGIKQNEIRLVLFFVSPRYDFFEVSRLMKEAFPNNDVIGCTTAGEIGPNGFTNGSISAMSIAADDFETSICIMKSIRSWSMLSKDVLTAAGEKLGFNSESKSGGFIISLIDGLQSCEEKVMNAVSNSFPHLGIVGGSAGDDEKFKETFVSANGEVFKDAAIITFVRTSKKFFLYKENIYVPTDIQFKVTKSDVANRIVYEFDGEPSAEKYAKALGITLDELPEYFRTNPTGRIILDNVWISSPGMIHEEKFIKYFCSIPSGSLVKLLKPIDALTAAKNTTMKILRNIPDCKGVLLFNCILRYQLFKKQSLCEQLAEEYFKCGPICGFNTYGEQFNRLHVNQTLTLIAFGD